METQQANSADRNLPHGLSNDPERQPGLFQITNCPATCGGRVILIGSMSSCSSIKRRPRQ